MSMNWLSRLPTAGCVVFWQNGERTLFRGLFAAK